MSNANLGSIDFRHQLGRIQNVYLQRWPTHSIGSFVETERQDGAMVGTVRYPDSSRVPGCRVTCHVIPSGAVVAKVFANENGEYEVTGLNIVSRSYYAVAHDPLASPAYQYLIRTFVP